MPDVRSRVAISTYFLPLLTRRTDHGPRYHSSMSTTGTMAYTTRTAAEAAGVPHHRLLTAIRSGKLPEPERRLGPIRLLTDEDVERARAFFHGRKEASR